MSKQYRTRENDITAVDTKTQLTTVGSESAPGALLVPQGVSRLLGVWVASMADFAATGSASIFGRIEGSGLPNGPETLTIGAHGGNVATGAVGCQNAKYHPIDVPVTSGNEVLLFAEMAGADIGTVSVVMTLVFQ